jgi:biopolymer transport protein ExbD
MKFRRSTKLLVEPSSVTTGDIAFNLIVFFLVCASSSPDSGRKQSIPRSETIPKEQQQKQQHVEVQLRRTSMAINGDPVRPADFVTRLRGLLAGKTREEDRVVVVKSENDVPYHHWILATSMVEEAGGIITIQRAEERQVYTAR